MTNSTAAAPLSAEQLDKLEALAKAAKENDFVNGTSLTNEFLAFTDEANPDTIFALIAQARAAQPQTGAADTTTSASSDYDCYNCGGKESAHREGCPALAPVAAQQAAAKAPAAQAVTVPEGWKLVPIEPTPEMIAANGSCDVPEGAQMLAEDARTTWAVMLAASPASTPEASQQAEHSGKDSGCRMTGGICACRSGGSFGGCAKERAYCCTNEPSRATQQEGGNE